MEYLEYQLKTMEVSCFAQLHGSIQITP